MNEYKIVKEVVSVEDYINIRKFTLGPREKSSVEKGLVNSWFGVHLVNEKGESIGMGRIIGDGGLTFTVTDIAVLPQYQGQGLGKVIMRELMEYYNENAPHDAYLNLMAVKEARFLYEKFGFVDTGKDIGMKYFRDKK